MLQAFRLDHLSVLRCEQWPPTSTYCHAVSIGIMTLRNAFDSCVKSWQYFRMHGIPLNSVKFPFLWYSQVRQDRCGGWREIHVKNVTKQAQHLHCDRSDNAALHGGHMHDLDYTVNMLGLCDPSNLLFILSAEEWRALLKLLWGLVLSNSLSYDIVRFVKIEVGVEEKFMWKM